MKHRRTVKSFLRRIAVRRLKKSRETVLLALGMLFSVLLVSFFLFFTDTVKGESNVLAQGLPHIEFVRSVADGMSLAATLLSIATLMTMRTWAKLSTEASAGTMAVLNSMGATASQRRYLLLTELSMQYLPSLLVGTTLGAVGGLWMSVSLLGEAVDTTANITGYVLLWLTILLVSGGLLVLCYTLPNIRIKGLTPSATESLRRRGRVVSTEAHGYRKSKTYQRKSLLKRLATKSVDFYKARYGSMALSLAVSAFYPLLAILLMYHLMDASVMMDTNPFDFADTADAVAASVVGLLTIIAAGFLLLTAQGVWGGVLLVRTQLEQRRSAGRAYLSMGMTERDIRRVMLLELRSLFLRSGLYLLLFLLIANFSFSQII